MDAHHTLLTGVVDFATVRVAASAYKCLNVGVGRRERMATCNHSIGLTFIEMPQRHKQTAFDLVIHAPPLLHHLLQVVGRCQSGGFRMFEGDQTAFQGLANGGDAAHHALLQQHHEEPPRQGL